MHPSVYLSVSHVCGILRNMSTGKLYNRTCTQCGRPFQSENRKARICSKTCRSASYQSRLNHLRKRVERNCEQCGRTYEVHTCRIGRYCSQACNRAAMAARNTKSVRTSKWTQCAYCGSDVLRYKSRTAIYERAFCNTECYHRWDSWYKQQPEQAQILAERIMRTIQPTVSRVEDTVARWLDTNGLTYERQVPLMRGTADFKVGDTYVEVHGCYWHGCPQCYSTQTPKQCKVQARDKGKATYCKRRGLTLLVIWEHDVQQGDFSALYSLKPRDA